MECDFSLLGLAVFGLASVLHPCLLSVSTVIHILQKQNVKPNGLSYPKRMNGF